MRLGKKKCSSEDIVWVSRAAKLSGVAREITSVKTAGMNCLAATHFRDSLAELRDALESGGAKPQLIDSRIDPIALVRRLRESGQAGVYVILSESMEVHDGRAEIASSPALRVVVAERYPTGSRDEVILAFAQACGLEGPVRFHSSLEDPLFSMFAGHRTVSLLKTLGVPESESIESNQLSSAISAAQKKAAKEAIADERVTSAEDWFKYNLRRKT